MIDLLEALRMAADTGVLTLIWLVQVVIYPSFKRYSEPELRSWHPIYTRRVTFVVLPLMFAQLGLSCYHVIMVSSLVDYLHLVLVVIAWMITFLVAVPLHQTLEEGNCLDSAHRLVKVNVWRTLVWTLVWLLSVVSLY